MEDIDDIIESLYPSYKLKDYPEVETVDFPREIIIVYAVCSKQCGNEQFIVDGSTQTCEYCYREMLKKRSRKYVLAEDSK